MAKTPFKLAYDHKKCPNPWTRPPKPDWLKDNRELGPRNEALFISYQYWTKLYWATPPWLNQSQIAELRAIYMARKVGEHIDHIVPLKNDLVCGLHVPWNLQTLPAGVNLSKSNKFWPDCPFENLDLFNE